MHDREVLYHPHIHAGLTERDVEDVAAAFRKVHRHRARLA